MLKKGAAVDPLTLILTALDTGVALGFKDTASATVTHAYNGVMAGELTDAGTGQDSNAIAAAQLLLSLADAAGAGRASTPFR